MSCCSAESAGCAGPTRLATINTLKALQAPEVRARYENLGAEPFTLTPEAFDAFVRAQAEVAATIVKAANIRAN